MNTVPRVHYWNSHGFRTIFRKIANTSSTVTYYSVLEHGDHQITKKEITLDLNVTDSRRYIKKRLQLKLLERAINDQRIRWDGGVKQTASQLAYKLQHQINHSVLFGTERHEQQDTPRPSSSQN